MRRHSAGFVPSAPHSDAGSRLDRVRVHHGAAQVEQLGLSRQHIGEQSVVGQRRYDAGKTRVRDAHARECIANGVFLVDAPDNETLVRAELVTGEAERSGLGPADVVRLDCLDGHRQHVARLGAVDKDRAGQCVDDAESLPGDGIGAGKFVRVEGQVEGVAAEEYDALARVGPGNHRDVGMQAVDARRILGAAHAAVADDDLGGGVRKYHQARQQPNGQTSGKA